MLEVIVRVRLLRGMKLGGGVYAHYFNNVGILLV